MSERDLLLWNVLADPADITARLVFADWLEEHDEPERAALIRLQCAGEGESVWPLVFDLCFRRKTFAQLVPGADYHSVSVSPAVPTLLHYDSKRDPHRTTLTLSHGFIERVELTCEAFMRPGFAEELFRRHPVRDVVLTDRVPEEMQPGGESGGEWGWAVSVITARRLHAAAPNEEIGKSLREMAPRRTALGIWAPFPSKADAVSAYSRACVLWARRLAGLPDLPEPAPV